MCSNSYLVSFSELLLGNWGIIVSFAELGGFKFSLKLVKAQRNENKRVENKETKEMKKVKKKEPN